MLTVVQEGPARLPKTGDSEIDAALGVAERVLVKNCLPKAGIPAPTVCGREDGRSYPNWQHVVDNFFINKVAKYLFEDVSAEWPARLIAANQAPYGKVRGSVYGIPQRDWLTTWEFARDSGEKHSVWMPLGRRLEDDADEFRNDVYLPYPIEHFFVLLVHERWKDSGRLPFLIEMYPAVRRAIMFLRKHHMDQSDGLITCGKIIADKTLDGSRSMNTMKRSEDQVLLYAALNAFAEMSSFVGASKDPAMAREWAKQVKASCVEKMWDKNRLIFGIDAKTEEPHLGYVSASYALGYSILYGLVDEKEKINAIFDYVESFEFSIPGPYYLPPIRKEDNPPYPPGVYANGGIGWARGVMPSVVIAMFRHGRAARATQYILDMARAANELGTFPEYWTWSQYTGSTLARGAMDYSETAAGFVDAVQHGLLKHQTCN